jgi:peptidoglycan/LPS O-acetylase OafA/YrhL
LAIEEQFYLVWPALVLWLPRRALMFTMASLIVMAALTRLWLSVAIDPWAGYTATIARADSLAWGAWLAITPVTPVRQLAAAAALLVVASISTSAWIVSAEWAGIAMSGACLTYACTGPSLLRSALSWRPLVGLGTISYGVYVFHVMIPYAFGTLAWSVQRRLGVTLELPAAGVERFLVIGVMTILVSRASWVLMERPLNRLKRKVPYRRKPRSPSDEPAVSTRASSHAQVPVRAPPATDSQ